MVDTLEEFILQELRERNCSVHYWGDGSPTLVSALIGVKLRISCSVSKGSSDDLIRVRCVPTIRFLKEGYPKADAWIVDDPELLPTLLKDRDRIRRKVRGRWPVG
jgi:hypothetical protein